MTQIVVDPATVAKLHELQEPVQLTDAAGRVLGRFVPGACDARFEPQISLEEAERRLSEGPGRTLDEILRDLEKRQ